MKTSLERNQIQEIEADALMALGFEKDGRLTGGALELIDNLTGGWCAEVAASGELSGKLLESALLHRPAGLKARRLLLVGGGREDKFTQVEMRRAAAASVRLLKSKGARTIALYLDGRLAAPEFVAAAIQGAVTGNFEPDAHKTKKEDGKAADSFAVVIPAGAAALDEAAGRAGIIADAQNFARELINEPANLMTPSVLVARARALAGETNLECEVLDQDRMRQLGMGALLGVAQGSAEPPALIILRYRPERAAATADHLGLIGKGVTFDSGGVSIKPSEGMEKMKYDMAGAAAVLGAMKALAALKPSIPVTALVPAVENMCGSRAQRPGDIVTTLAGKTVEVLNTDAEGRMILADAITYAGRLGCTHLVDAATLTGAIAVALGHVRIGVFSNDDALLERVMAAARAQGEKMWPMPLDEEYKDLLKSEFADLANVGPRWGGAVTAAYFLKEFAGETPWVHLDIAGTAWLDESKPHLPKGPTGVGVRTLAELALNW